MSGESKLGSRDRTWIEVDLEAVRENARTVARRSGARLLPMVKADAYGLGALAVAKALEPLDPWGFGVATAEEGRALREGGVARPILVWQPTMPMLPACAQHGLTPALGAVEEVRAWQNLAGDRAFHVQVDTGMNRGGVAWEAFASASPTFADAPGFGGLCTHFHSAETDPASVREQWDRLRAAIGALARRPALVHAANSAAALSHPGTAGDLVRPGIFLYGGAAGEHRPRPVVSWRSRVSRVAWREAGATVSYGATYRTGVPTCLTTLAVGYADGYRRSLSNVGEVLIGGRRHRVAGAVTMDYTVVASERDAVTADAVATLLGRDGSDEILVDDLARAAGTISYEILTGLGSRVERFYP